MLFAIATRCIIKAKGEYTMDFTGKVAISTGAASGMGLLFAENWAALGENIMIDGGRNALPRIR